MQPTHIGVMTSREGLTIAADITLHLTPSNRKQTHRPFFWCPNSQVAPIDGSFSNGVNTGFAISAPWLWPPVKSLLHLFGIVDAVGSVGTVGIVGTVDALV